MSRAQAASQPYCHLQCLGVPLESRSNVVGFDDLPANIAATVLPYFEHEDVHMVDSQQSVDASMAPVNANTNDPETNKEGHWTQSIEIHLSQMLPKLPQVVQIRRNVICESQYVPANRFPNRYFLNLNFRC